jgi:hypothetical protein
LHRLQTPVNFKTVKHLYTEYAKCAGNLEQYILIHSGDQKAGKRMSAKPYLLMMKRIEFALQFETLKYDFNIQRHFKYAKYQRDNSRKTK